jgi:hypothetical protein
VQIDEALQEKALAPSYVSCSSSRQSLLVTALGNAQTMSQKSHDYLNNLPTASRSTDAAYKTWFGAYTSSRYAGVTSDYVNLYSAMSTKSFVFYCDCTDSSYAYVFANQPYKVHLCGAFWSAPALGTDSKAGTLVHETSHFTVVAGTQDYACLRPERLQEPGDLKPVPRRPQRRQPRVLRREPLNSRHRAGGHCRPRFAADQELATARSEGPLRAWRPRLRQAMRTAASLQDRRPFISEGGCDIQYR